MEYAGARFRYINELADVAFFNAKAISLECPGATLGFSPRRAIRNGPSVRAVLYLMPFSYLRYTTPPLEG